MTKNEKNQYEAGGNPEQQVTVAQKMCNMSDAIPFIGFPF